MTTERPKMRTRPIALLLFVFLMCPPAAAHTLHKADPLNKPRLPIDIKRVAVSHVPGRIIVAVAAHRKWRNRILTNRLQSVTGDNRAPRGKSAVFVTWRVVGGARMALAIHNKGKLLLRIFRGRGDKWVYIGTGKALRDGGRTIALGIPANRVGRLPKKTFHYAVTSQHLPKNVGFWVRDYAPSAGFYQHKIKRL